MKQDKTVAVVFETVDYEKFNHSKFNRKVHLSKKQIENFENFGIISPIIVNEHMTIIDGQHRLAAAAFLKIPIRYIMLSGKTVSDIVAINSVSNNWVTRDFLEAYAEDGNEDYKFVLRLLDNCSLREGALTRICENTISPVDKAVNSGNLKVHNRAVVENFVREYENFCKVIKIDINSTLAINMNVLYRYKKFSFERMAEKIIQTNTRDEIVPRLPLHIMLKKLLEIYNSKLSENSKTAINFIVNSRGLVEILEDKNEWAKKGE